MTVETVGAFTFVPDFADHSQFDECSITIERLSEEDYREVGGNLSAHSRTHEDAHTFQMTIRGRKNGFANLIGRVGCWNTPWSFYETHCQGLANWDYKGEGWGIELYHQLFKWGMENDIALCSSKISNRRFVISRHGIRVWNSKNLRSKYGIRKRDHRYRLIGLTES